ncbi:helix-turn-helix domain-containing protein [Candidatus Enterococcus ikei]|uniref:XRE family transcriptional regulator n=1 Tax=Candidatus Enterococcus ikei TaxID=2815326 RepID=A0ABS3H004_9ENTE|nr:XRE family transcriptional regulator [Enterococcus sp. DIV0869a]MBO0440839.1 XRE family transcriptional regulator [Enterococcus sp. DIV0869a]
MNIGKTISFFRKRLKFRQKELVNDHMESSSISRIEQGKQSLKVEALIEILNKMSLTTEEFFAKCLIDKTQDEWKKLFYKCAENPNNESTRKELIFYYEKIKNKEKSLKELVNYYSVKLYFSKFWTEIDSVTEQELDEAFNYLKSKEYYQQYDYILISNIILLMKNSQQEYLLSRTIPIEDESARTNEVKKIVCQILINLITSRIYRKDFVGAKRYLKNTEALDISRTDYRLALNIEYLKNLLGYLITGEAFYMKNIQTYIILLEFVGDEQTLKAIKEEVKILTYTNKNIVKIDENDFPIGILKE